MKTFSSKSELQQYLQTLHQKGSKVGFVPTMGALHEGHISLLRQAQRENDVVVCSIFVNPTQFNDPADLERYPRPIEADIKKLEAAGCDVLFNPPVDEIYSDNEQWHLEIGELETLLEGKFRPGHYQGVTQVVYKLFNIVQPHKAFFGQKDYQQFLVISRMVELLNMPVQLVMCPIMREPDGLAMSSRNIHLSKEEHKHALVLSRTLNWLKQNFDEARPAALLAEAKAQIGREAGVELEYLELANGENLQPFKPGTKNIVALLAARVGKTRLIDNVIIS